MSELSFLSKSLLLEYLQRVFFLSSLSIHSVTTTNHNCLTRLSRVFNLKEILTCQNNMSTARPRNSVKQIADRVNLEALNPMQATMRNALVGALNIPQFHQTSFHSYNANEPMEDRYIMQPDIGLFAVFDGHGGTHCSNFLSNHADCVITNELYKSISEKSFGRRALKKLSSTDRSATMEDEVILGEVASSTKSSPQSSPSQQIASTSVRPMVEKGLHRACLMMDDLYFHKVVSNPRDSGSTSSRPPTISGSCGVIACIYESCVTVANVGDCRIVIGQKTPLLPSAQVDASDSTSLSIAADEKPQNGNQPQNAESSPRKVRDKAEKFVLDSRRFMAVPLTIDQKASNKYEQELVRKRSSDAEPISVIQSTVGGTVVAEVSRVAGILIVTRAFGDGFLKYSEFSFHPYNQHVPYITAEPEIATYHLTDLDECMIIASDGLWDIFSNEEAVSIVLQNLQNTNIAKVLVDKALGRVASQHSMTREQLSAVPYGRRRGIHDDITVIVIIFKDPNTSAASGSTRKRVLSQTSSPNVSNALKRTDSFPFSIPGCKESVTSETGETQAAQTEPSTLLESTPIIQAVDQNRDDVKGLDISMNDNASKVLKESSSVEENAQTSSVSPQEITQPLTESTDLQGSEAEIQKTTHQPAHDSQETNEACSITSSS